MTTSIFLEILGVNVNVVLGIIFGLVAGGMISWGASKSHHAERIAELRDSMRQGDTVEQPLSTVIQELGQLYLTRGDITVGRWAEHHNALGRRIEFYYWTD